MLDICLYQTQFLEYKSVDANILIWVLGPDVLVCSVCRYSDVGETTLVVGEKYVSVISVDSEVAVVVVSVEYITR